VDKLQSSNYFLIMFGIYSIFITTEGNRKNTKYCPFNIRCLKSFDTYCFNNGQCILLEDIKEHHCKCKKGFYGPRCATPELVGRPVDEEQVVVILFCVTLLLIGLGGALYFFYKAQKQENLGKEVNVSDFQTSQA
uniref:EGF-like domain-containing protein n=1 Tax=Poecilia latipinna TaxID=48699 RepID=A0A3B3V908_9TELE